MPKSHILKNLPVSHNPWIYFFIFLAANTLLSYFPLALEIKFWIGLFGILLPGLTAFVFLLPPSPKNSRTREFLPPIPPWAWLMLGGVAVFTRFYHLTTFSVWPEYEEGSANYTSLELLRKWDWKLFYSSAEAPRGYVWGLSFLFRALGPSLTTLWLFPNLVSLFTVPFGYLAARQFFSRSFSFLAAFLLAVNFWPLYLGKYSGHAVLIPWWECFSFFLLGLFLNSIPKNRKIVSIVLGLVVGAGFYTYLSWVPVAAAVGLAVLAFAFIEKKISRFALFVSAALLMIAPLVAGAMNEGFGHYLTGLWAFSGSISAVEQIRISLSYISELFWGSDDSLHSYRPVWGGYFNPILGSLFFLGFIETVQNRFSRLNQWLLAALVLFLIPALVTKSLEPFRMVPILVIILALALRGLSHLLLHFKPRRAAAVTSVFFVFLFGLDFYHLVGRYQRVCQTPALWQPYMKSVERYRAYQILEKKAQMDGPGLIFSDFVPGFCDETLTIADYKFNAAMNPFLPSEKVSWAALLVNASYQPFLAKRFPDGKAYFLSKEFPKPNGGFMLWVMPAAGGKRETFRRWIRASQSLRPFIDQCLSWATGESFQPVVNKLASAYPSFEGDPFLESCFWEMMADNELKVPALGHQAAIQAIQQGIKKGYPSANLYHALGTFWWMDQNWGKARTAFQQARKTPLDITNSSQFLQGLP